MTRLELVKSAINFAMFDLCGGYLDMPSGCDGCPLCDKDNLDEDGNIDCRGKMLRDFIEQHKEELDYVSKNSWIPVTSHLPETGQKVRLFCKSHYGTYQCQGFYIPEKMNEEYSDYSWDFELLEYDEENDVNYIRARWYECVYNWDEYITGGIEDEVLYWMPFPDNPEEFLSKD